MVFECLFGTTPRMPVNSLPELINKQKTQPVSRLIPRFPKISPELRRVLIKMCICAPANSRPSAAQLLKDPDFIALTTRG